MNNYQNADQQYNINAKRALRLYATQRTRRRFGSGMASVDIHAWLLILALAFLLRDDPYSLLPLEVTGLAASLPTSETTRHPVRRAFEVASTPFGVARRPGLDPD